MKVKNVNIDSLNKRQQASMKKHGKHHTSKHLREMVKAMGRGRTFTLSHKSAMRKVGK